MKMILSTAFAAIALAMGSAAHAATYDFGAIGDDTTYTSNTINHDGGGSYTDYFTFNTTGPLTEYTTASITESPPYQTTSADLTLYSGTVNGTHSEIVSSGVFDPMTQPTPTIKAYLQAGDYYIEDDATVPAGSDGSYTVTATTSVSAAPEPSTWLLMIAGIGGIGLMLRQAKRHMGFRFRDAFAA